MKRQVSFHSPDNISGALKQNRVSALYPATEDFKNVKTTEKMHTHSLSE